MKFALVDGCKVEPRPRVNGICLCCDARVVSKCGKIMVWHWAHFSKLECDIWWENETQWHRDWKGYFPEEWQEVVHKAKDGEKHIADVKTRNGCVIEFQHSFISAEERRSRDNFYPNLVWVVDGLRRKRDKEQFFKALGAGVQVIANPSIIKTTSDESKLVQEWGNSGAHVFIDFGEEERIWWLLPFKSNGQSHVVQFSRQGFIDLHLGNKNISFINFLSNFLRDFLFHLQNKNNAHIKQQRAPMYNIRFYHPRSFEQRLARMKRRRRF